MFFRSVCRNLLHEKEGLGHCRPCRQALNARAQRRYRAGNKYAEARCRYRSSPKGRRTTAAYNRHYRSTEKGISAHQRADAKRRWTLSRQLDQIEANIRYLAKRHRAALSIVEVNSLG